jgi:hypothetical protein
MHNVWSYLSNYFASFHRKQFIFEILQTYLYVCHDAINRRQKMLNIVYVLLSIFGICANTLAIIVLLFSDMGEMKNGKLYRLRRLPMFQFLLCLTIADTIFLIAVVMTWTELELVNSLMCRVSGT